MVARSMRRFGMTSRFSPDKVKGTVASALTTCLVVATLFLAACGSSNNNATTKHVLTALGFVGGSYTQDMSPYSPNANVGVEGLLYEPLEYVNGVTGQSTGVLATGHQYSSDNKSLTFTLRQNVQWSDG